MKAADVIKRFTTPLGAPAFVRGPGRLINREYFNILYRTDAEALRAVVPEHLEIDDPLVRWEVMRMPDSSGLGDYTECGQVIQLRPGRGKDEYLHAMYLHNRPALAAGREGSAYSKMWGKPRLYVDSDTPVTIHGPFNVAGTEKTPGCAARPNRARTATPSCARRVTTPRQLRNCARRGSWADEARLHAPAAVAAVAADEPGAG